MSSEQSFMKAAFFGVVAEDLLFPFPSLAESEQDTLRAVLDRVRRALADTDSTQIDRERRIDEPTIERSRAAGLFGLVIPARYGGLGLTNFGCARVAQELGARDPSVALFLLTHNAIGARSLLSFGNDEQKQRYLPRLARGESVAAFALTEQASGTDAGTIRTHAELDPATGNYLLGGEKPWVTNGAEAELFTVFARTSRPDEGHKPRLTAFLVERGAGVSTGERLETLGVRGVSVTPLNLDGVTLGKEAVLGDAGRGYRVAVAVLNDARIALAASNFGQARALLDRTVRHVAKRRSFGRAIGEFPIIKDKIAKMMSDCYAVESMIYSTAALADQGVEDYSLESAICRVASVESLWRVVNESLHVVAGRGYVAGDGFERSLRDARVGFVLDGTNETLRCFIALAGLRGPGSRLEEVESAMLEPLKGFGLLRRFAPRRVREALRRERLTRASPLLGREAVMFEECVDALQEASLRVLREHGREIAEIQYAQKRLANVAIDLYALAACLARTTLALDNRGETGARRELDLTTMFASAAHARMKSHLKRLFTNDDELRKLIAARAYTDGGYPFEVV